MTKQIFVALISLFLCYKCQAQQLSLKDYQRKYPDESKICLNNKRNIFIDLNGDSLHITMRNYEESLYLDKNSILHANQSVIFSDNFKITSLLAETQLPGSSGNKKIKVNNFDTSDYRDPMVFFGDVKSINFSFPKLEEGAISLLDYKYNITEPRNLGTFYFNSYVPVCSAELTVSCPSEVIIGYKLFNCDSLNVDFTRKHIGNNIEYSWKAKNIHKFPVEENSPSLPYFASHMFVYIKGYTVPDKNVKLISDENDLHNWYHSLISSLNSTSVPPALKYLVDSLTINYNSEPDKVKSIFYWVQDHIKYIAIEAGDGGFVPRNAGEVFSKLYGDCKDMASLVNKMLEIAGIESHLTWVGTRNIPYNYHDLPLPLSDNHMIVTYKNKNNYFFLDATTGPHSLNYPPYNIQGKETMIDMGPDKFEIVKVPEVDYNLNTKSDTVRIMLDGKKIKGNGESYFKGYERVELYNYLCYKDPTEQTKFMKNFFEKGNNKFLIDSYKIKYFDQRDNDLIISYNFNVSDYCQAVGDEIFINLNLDKANLGEPVKNDRKTSIEANFKKKIINVVSLKIPLGYKIAYLPDNSVFNDSLFGFNTSYKAIGDEIILTNEIYLNYLLLEPSKFKDWNNMIESLNNSYKLSVVLVKDTKVMR